MNDLNVRGLVRRIADFELRADFRAGAGERVAVSGRSGVGKTSLLRAILGLDTKSDRVAGKILLGQDDITDSPTEKRQIGWVPQNPSLLASLSVLENAAFGLRVRGAGAAERRAEVMPWLERMGLSILADESVGRLSGGERSRVAFIRALVWKPRLLLLDEPFTALDPALRVSLRSQLVELHLLWPVPLLLVSHDESDIASVATSTLLVREDATRRERSFTRG